MRTNYERAVGLLKEMNLEEKVAQLCSAWLEISEDGSFSVKETAFRTDRPAHDREMVLGNGIGQLTRPYGTRSYAPRKVARGINEIQRYLTGRTRLGIPAMLHEECLAGAMVQDATIFPCSINYGATWDTSLMYRISRAIGRELASLGIHEGLAPVLDVARDARWGRLEETFGEDPYLVGSMGISYVKGLQGPDRSPISTLKHFVGHSSSEGGRNHAPVHIGQRELSNTFALPFEMVVKAAAPGAVMPAYHDIDGEPCSSSHSLITGLLKNTWGFDGLVVADYEAPMQLFADHKVARDVAEAAALALKAGMDMELPSSTTFKDGLLEAVGRGLVEMAEVDASVLKILLEKYRLGLFDHPFIEIDAIELGSSENHGLAVEVAEKSMVLLKNTGVLPLPQAGSIALIGPLADHPYAMLSGYSAPVHLQGSSNPEDTVPARALSIRKALESVRGKATIRYEQGCKIYDNSFKDAVYFPGDVSENEQNSLQLPSSDTSGIHSAVALAKESDVAVVVVGDLVGLFQHGTVGEGSDVSSLKLPGVQQQLLDAVLETGKPVVVVLVSGRPYELGNALEGAEAILATWLPGEGGGEATARILFGLAVPGGKTPLSFPKTAGAMPHFYNYSFKAPGLPKQRQFESMFPFGYGLSYTQFSYGDCSVDALTVSNDGTLRVSAIIGNTGTYSGDEVVQLYVRDCQASIVRPVKELKGFARVSLVPGTRRRVVFALPVDMLSFIADGTTRIVEPGAFEIMIGRSSRDIVWSQEVEVLGPERVLPHDWRFQTDVTIEEIIG
ncbi:MAG: beta-glucosidase [Spirochaetes bacterium GWC2_52_13]|nr:MAG: beta-glucosidase [Spirochaetes bacterium GWC2_52_13]HCG63064.1 beta-glucosidase [Sphaerochaeta sp.]